MRFRKPGCQKVQQMLSPYIDGRLKPGHRLTVEHHLKDCPGCREELGMLEMTVQLLRRLPQATQPRSFTLARPVPRPVKAGFGWLRPATALVAVLLTVVLLGDFFQLFEPGVEVLAPPAEERMLAQDVGVEAAPEESNKAELEEAGAALGEVEAAWLFQAEIGLAAVVVVLAGLAVFARRQAMKGRRTGGVG